MTLPDDELKKFIESDVVVLVGTRDAELAGEMTFGWGPRVLPGSEVELFVDDKASVKTLANLRDNRLLSVTCTSPITYQSVQLKGWCVEIGQPTEGDLEWVAKHRETFMHSARARGLAAHAVTSMWSRDVVRLRLLPHERFDQTPGPGAGRKL